MTQDPREVLTSALNMWWLRPENALSVASYTLRGVDLAPADGGRAADFACGDGVNTFFKLGGRFDPAFDIFGAAVRAESAQTVVDSKIDVFDHFDEDYNPAIVTRPAARYAYGTDHKPNLLRKAGRLGFYENLLEADLAADTAIPDGSLDLIYCNSLYWTADVDTAVGHMYRKLAPGGLAVFDVMTSHRKALHFQHLMPTLPQSWQALMNRGRDVNNPGIRSDREWRNCLRAGGVAELVEVRDIFPIAIAHAWNVGLRPVFPVLNRMAGALSPDDRQSIKREWVETWTDLLLPVLLEPQEFSRSPLQVRLQFVLRRR